ncbi:MAG: hypothetical protein KBD27_02330 [Candidatus Moranbacteria bacterium]|nr:hypothetical protein [Candidatus Moranbacteria bacterium]
MNRKIILIILLIVVAVGAIGYFTFFKNSVPYASQKECEQKTGKQCSLFKGLCQVGEAQNQSEAEANEKFLKDCLPKIGTWQPTETISATTNQQKPISEPQPLIFEKVNLHSDWRLKSSFNYSTYKGIFRNENELKKVFGSMVNAYDEQQAFWEKKHEPQPVMPVIDFSKYSVIWYADRGSNASFTTLKKVLEYNDFIEAQVTPFYSDFGSSHLNLWTIPKTDKEIRFVETKEYEQGGL